VAGGKTCPAAFTNLEPVFGNRFTRLVLVDNAAQNA
jgi:hypothetical protein